MWRLRLYRRWQEMVEGGTCGACPAAIHIRAKRPLLRPLSFLTFPGLLSRLLLLAELEQPADPKQPVEELDHAGAQLLGKAAELGQAGFELSVRGGRRVVSQDQEVGRGVEGTGEAAQHFGPRLVASALVLADLGRRGANPRGKLGLAQLPLAAEEMDT